VTDAVATNEADDSYDLNWLNEHAQDRDGGDPAVLILGLAPGRLGLAADLAAEPSLAAGEGVAAGAHLHLQAAAALPDHPASEPLMSFHLEVKEMTSE
jgi:hypothetical protein